MQKIDLLWENKKNHCREREANNWKEKWRLTQSLRALAGLDDEPAMDVTFAFKIVNLLLEGQ